MKPGTATSPTAITLPREAKAWAVRKGVNLSATFSAYLTEMMKEDPDRAGKPASVDGPVRSTTQPKRKGVQKDARGGG